MRSRSTFSLGALVSACALGLAACGGVPLDELPADATSVFFIYGTEEFAFASWRLDTQSCIQLPEDTTVTFNGVDPVQGELFLGGRRSNPLAAYIDVGCDVPSAYWNVTGPATPPFVIEVSSGGTTLLMELSSRTEITRCDFPSCVSESFDPDEEFVDRGER